jgi:pyruvate formate lyase activating enzyme
MSNMKVDSQPKGLVFSVDRNVVDDGPGIRTTVFLKGCPLRCVWCHSPQSQSKEQQLLFIENRCIACGACVESCPKDAQEISGTARRILWERCDDCGECARVCPPMALEMAGEWMTVEQIVDVVRRDAVYYKNTGGGVTFSGGEALAQPEFLTACLERCKQEGINTAVDTSGFAQWSVLERILPHTDLFLYDLKQMDSRKHEEMTGVGNAVILENLQRIDGRGKPVWVRVPLIPGYNDSIENLTLVAEFIKTLTNVERISLLPYNGAAGAKYSFVGRKYGLEHLDGQTDQEKTDFLKIFSSVGLAVEVGR